jgi:hypothetical protein
VAPEATVLSQRLRDRQLLEAAAVVAAPITGLLAVLAVQAVLVVAVVVVAPMVHQLPGPSTEAAAVVAGDWMMTAPTIQQVLLAGLVSSSLVTQTDCKT